MCMICGQFRCPAGCPNAPEPVAVYDCSYCQEGIIPGDEYAEIDGRYYHLECLEAMDVREVLELFGTFTYTAEENEP